MSKGLMDTNIDLYLQKEESTTRPVEELVDIQVDPNEPSCVIKIGKGLSKELAQLLTEFHATTKMCLHGHIQTW